MPTYSPKFALRSLLRRQLINVDLHPSELHDLIRLHEARATLAAEHPEQIGYADYLLERAAALREAGR